MGKSWRQTRLFPPEVEQSIGLDKHLPFNRFKSPDEIVEHLLKYLKPFPNPDALKKLDLGKLSLDKVEFAIPGGGVVIEKIEPTSAPAAMSAFSPASGQGSERKQPDDSASYAAVVSGLAGNLWGLASVRPVGVEVSAPDPELARRVAPPGAGCGSAS